VKIGRKLIFDVNGAGTNPENPSLLVPSEKRHSGGQSNPFRRLPVIILICRLINNQHHFKPD